MDFSIKTSIGIALSLITSASSALASEVFHSPSLCEPTEQVLVLQNLTRTQQRAWVQVRLDDFVDEIQWDIKPQEKIEIKTSEFLRDKKYFSVKPLNDQAFRFTVKCSDGPLWNLTSATSPEVIHYVPSQSRSFKIHLQNLFLQPQNVKLRAFDKFQNLVAEQEVTLDKSYDTKSLKWSLSSDVSRVDVVGTQRLHSDVFFIQNNKEVQSPGLPQVSLLEPAPEKTYFLVSTKSSSSDEAFVIALDETSKIATAREQIQNPLLEKIIVAGIELGHGGFNRAFKARDKSPYSWAVHRVDAFADFAHIDCDGSPDLTEERLEQKLSEGGRICFWRYRVIRELSIEEVRSGKLK